MEFGAFEREYWKDNTVVAGADEVGMGAFAGPVVAAVVSFAASTKSQIAGHKFIRIEDSKKLTENRRNDANGWIIENADFVGIGEGSVNEIDRLGIRGALGLAYRRALKNFKCGVLLIDGFEIPLLTVAQKAIVKGDSKVFSIAAASIVAKVYRDNLMVQLNKELDKYSWDKNKGYGTADHRKAILTHGKSNYHRELYVRNCLKMKLS